MIISSSINAKLEVLETFQEFQGNLEAHLM